MSIIDNAKEIATLVQKLGDVELYRKIVELEGEIIEFTRENRELERTVEELRASSIVIEGLVFDSPFYITPDGAELYCARCVEVDRRAVHVARTAESRLRRRIWKCPECNCEYADMRGG